MGVKERYFLFLCVDSLIAALSVYVGYFILTPYFYEQTLSVLIITSMILLVSHHLFAYIFNLYHRAWQYASIRELISILQAVTSSVLLTYIVTLLLFDESLLRLLIITWMMHMILTSLSRLSWRMLIYQQNGNGKRNRKLTRTLIVGMGRGGSVLVNQILESPSMGMNPVVAVDDDPNKQGVEVTGRIKVEGTRNDIGRLVKKYGIKKIVIAIPSLKKKELNKINDMCLHEGVEVMIMPSIKGVLSGRLEVNALKKVEVEDLLGREPVMLDCDEIEEQLMHKTILVSGAGGSIGSEIVRQVSKFQPVRIILLGRGENSIYNILEEVSVLQNNIEYIPVIADVQDRARIFEVFERHRPDIIYHAAAHKHVPMMEHNPKEAVKNNVVGTKNIAEAACHFKADKFVMISTDKAVNPPNIMGGTKRMAEMIIQALDKHCEHTTLTAVRFGNVLGSRGSVIPKFKHQIEMGGPVTVTDLRMTRYFMTIPEASRLVIQSGAISEGGEIFVLDMGEPVKIVDLAKNMIRLSGFAEDEIGIEVIGLRPGEKLYEELLDASEIHPNQVFDKIYRGKVSESSLSEIEAKIIQFLAADNKEVKNKVLEFIGQSHAV
jgi:FlaA1/EpsC-like NDP-sugar epimerase